jgi:hypothetical protein
MPGLDDTGSTAGHLDDDRQTQQSLSRRSVLRGAAGVGVAGLAATALASTAGPALAAARPAASRAMAKAPAAEAPAADTGEPIIVHVRDTSSGEIDIFRGTSQVRLRDPELVARLARASR